MLNMQQYWLVLFVSEAIFLSDNKICNEGAVAIISSLSRCSNLKELWIGNNDIGDDGAKAISTHCMNWTNLRKLSAYNNNIERDGAEAIFNGLKVCTKLVHLGLGRNSIGSDGAEALSMHLKYWPKLQHLVLNGTEAKPNIGRNGAVLIAKNLHHCTQLKYLGLRFNNIDEDTQPSLAKCAKLVAIY